uniref:Leucine-rich repeat protein n=1 Tax=Paramoeba aestuarina TaxID=180227 RepID=A0A7S4KSB0_9EUKA|mmetsp:Transcript_23893/g.37217  ORF Transcript_23893/g.37217 Transcript_23893/m.37217 type:complete len:222 (+) Transcript_23893:36-701(+)
MLSLTFVSTADPSLGKIDKTTMSQQTLMELLIDGITNKAIICGSAEDPWNIANWEGISLNHSGEVTRIEWSWYDPDGSLALEWLPSTVEKFEVFHSIFSATWLTGTINLTSLPDLMESLSLYGSNLTGEVALRSLPSKMEILDLRNNKFFGAVDLRSLPSTLDTLRLSRNDFEGVTDFSRLPTALVMLDISNTRLEGVIEVDLNRVKYSVEGSHVKIIHTK